MNDPDEANRDALLAAEAATLARLRRTARAFEKRSRELLDNPVRLEGLARELEVRFGDDLTTSRAATRERAARQHRIEVVALGSALAIPAIVRSTHRVTVVDEASSRAAAGALAHGWRLLTQRAARLANAAGAGSFARALLPRLQRTAATETAAAYNAQRLELGSKLARKEPAAARDFEWRWDGLLDRRTCPVCSSMHGKRWPLDSPPIVRPPVHPYCRCVLSLRAVARLKKKAA